MIPRIVEDVLDQVLHTGWAFGALAIVGVFPLEWWAYPIAGIALALPREFVDQWPINRWWDTVIDLTFFGVGGLAVGLMMEMLK